VLDLSSTESLARTRIKICGLTNQRDVAAAVLAGADAVGFVFYAPSPRNVEVSFAAALAKDLPPWVSPVALFVNPTQQEVAAVIAQIPPITLQFHADEDNAFCAQFNRPFIKAARMHPGLDLVKFTQSFPDAAAILVDALVDGYGGAGHTFDWALLPKVSTLGKPLILSGGLSSANVAEAIHVVRPYAVDVSSGVERERGVKCPTKIVEFCQAVLSVKSRQESKG
jgi:phosphoribosylanthranilate isomerase